MKTGPKLMLLLRIAFQEEEQVQAQIPVQGPFFS